MYFGWDFSEILANDSRHAEIFLGITGKSAKISGGQRTFIDTHEIFVNNSRVI
jgi:hypothetical protein